MTNARQLTNPGRHHAVKKIDTAISANQALFVQPYFEMHFLTRMTLFVPAFRCVHNQVKIPNKLWKTLNFCCNLLFSFIFLIFDGHQNLQNVRRKNRINNFDRVLADCNYIQLDPVLSNLTHMGHLLMIMSNFWIMMH